MNRITPLFLLIVALCCTLLPLGACSSSRSSGSTKTLRPAPESERGEADDEEEEEAGREREEHERMPPPPPMAWGSGLAIESMEAAGDTLRFHVGSPLFFRIRVADQAACAPFIGKPFYFDRSGAQLGWGFEEVADSLLFPRTGGACERVVMLSAENANRIAEGTYTLKLLLFLDGGTKLYSDTVVVQAVRSVDGANNLSYVRFLQEQILRNSPLLADPETIRALFADGTPKSAESEVYRAAILYRVGDATGADAALASARAMAAARGRELDRAASGTLGALTRVLRSSPPQR